MDRRKRDIEGLVSGAGLKLAALTLNGKNHYRAKIVAIDGREKHVTFSNTPSDRRGDMNKKSMLKRFSRGVEGGRG